MACVEGTLSLSGLSIQLRHRQEKPCLSGSQPAQLTQKDCDFFWFRTRGSLGSRLTELEVGSSQRELEEIVPKLLADKEAVPRQKQVNLCVCLTTHIAPLLRGIRWFPKEPTSAECFKIVPLVTPAIQRTY